MPPVPGFLGIDLASWLTIAAIILGPVTALTLQRWSERRRQAKDRKVIVFRELMATRATSARVSPRHVDALNAIEVEFSTQTGKDKEVYNAWRTYLDHLNDYPQNEKDPNFTAQATVWSSKTDELLVALLYRMSKALKYSFTEVELKKGIYYPKAHGDVELDQFLLRKHVVDILGGRKLIWTGVVTGDRPLDMRVTNFQEIAAPPADEAAQPGSASEPTTSS